MRVKDKLDAEIIEFSPGDCGSSRKFFFLTLATDRPEMIRKLFGFTIENR
jgi:hypothetical protein